VELNWFLVMELSPECNILVEPKRIAGFVTDAIIFELRNTIRSFLRQRNEL
jgi:hypothetical protein